MGDMDDDEILAAGADPATGPRAWARRRRKALRRCAIAAVALWFFWYPMDRAELFYALPERTAAAAYVRNLAMEDRALLRNPSFQYALRALGGDPEDAIDDNAGVFWTLFWLTGENSVVGVVPEEGECAGLGGYLAGASYVGWKARALELLWRIRWVPGLGPLRTTAKGTRYMEFPHARELRDNGIVLGLDIVDGVLVAVLAQDPDRVAELAARVAGKTDSWQRLAGCFKAGGPVQADREPEPWREIRKRHRIWVQPYDLGPYAFDCNPFTLDLASLKRPGIELDATIGAGSGTLDRIPSLGAAAPLVDAARLKVGGETSLDFGYRNSSSVRAVVQSISPVTAKGEVAVVFRCSSALAETLSLRQSEAEVVFQTYSGLKVPKRAVHVEGGKTVVYAVSAGVMEMKGVEILYEGEDFYLVAAENEGGSLRADNEVIVSGRGLGDGNVVN